MWGTSIRGFIAFAVVVALIAAIWTRLEDDARTAETLAASTTTSTTTTTTLPPTTTTTPEQAIEAACERAEDFVLEAFVVGEENGPGAVAESALQFWTDVEPLVPFDTATEVTAVIQYYEDYLQVAAPHEFDATTIIRDGDKLRFEQLVTRPAPGLEPSRGFFVFFCGLDLPDQPRLSTSEFDRIDRRVNPPSRR